MQAFDLDPNLYAPVFSEFRLWPWPRQPRRPAPDPAGRPVVREWRGRVPAHKTEAYFEYLQRTGLPGYAATPGHRGTWVLAERGAEETEFVLLTLWDSPEAIRAFAGEDIGAARYYPDDGDYLREMPPRLRHYEVLAAPRRGA